MVKEKNAHFVQKSHPSYDAKKIIHYYVDGGIKEELSVAAFIKKGFGFNQEIGVRRYKNYKSSKTEMRAIQIAADDAIVNGIDPHTVVIHTDDKSILNPDLRKSSDLYILKSHLDKLGFNIAYMKSTHSTAEIESKGQKNAYQVHKVIQDEFKRSDNRYRKHLNKKRNKKRIEKQKQNAKSNANKKQTNNSKTSNRKGGVNQNQKK